MNKTPVPKLEDLDKKWFIVDAQDQRLGRLATEIANVLRGKNKPTLGYLYSVLCLRPSQFGI